MYIYLMEIIDAPRVFHPLFFVLFFCRTVRGPAFSYHCLTMPAAFIMFYLRRKGI